MPIYNAKSERSLIELFPTLEPVTELNGVYVPELSGPNILKPVKKAFLNLTGLPGWGGKQFYKGHALNLIKLKKNVVHGPKMILSIEASTTDGKNGLVAKYEKDAPFIWRRCTDEFRILDNKTILGMSRFDLLGMRGKPVMFLLHQAPHNKGGVVN